MRSRRVLPVLLSVCSALVFSSAALASGDDYPYSDTAAYPSGAADPWGFTYRDSTSFVAWRLHQAGQTTFASDMTYNGVQGHWGDADNWDQTAKVLGIGVGSVPEVGAIAQWHANESSSYSVGSHSSGTTTSTTYTMTAGPQGQVAIVTAVNPNGTVVVDQYNANPTHPYSYSYATVQAPRFLYIGVPQPQDTGANAQIHLSQTSTHGQVTFTLATYPTSAGSWAYFFRRSGMTGQVVPFGKSRIDSTGAATRSVVVQTGQILSIYAKDTAVASPTSPYSNTISFKVN